MTIWFWGGGGGLANFVSGRMNYFQHEPGRKKNIVRYTNWQGQNIYFHPQQNFESKKTPQEWVGGGGRMLIQKGGRTGVSMWFFFVAFLRTTGMRTCIIQYRQPLCAYSEYVNGAAACLKFIWLSICIQSIILSKNNCNWKGGSGGPPQDNFKWFSYKLVQF